MNLSNQLTAIAERQPRKPAYIFAGKDENYGELDSKIDIFASKLHELGLQKGDHIALVTGNSPYFVIGLYGILRAGMTVVPVNPLYTPKELTYIMNNGDVKGVIMMDILLDKFLAIDKELPMIQYYISCETGRDNQVNTALLSPKMKSFTAMMKTPFKPFTAPELDDDDVALILYTSGTTGQPKGAMLTHRNLYSNAKDVADYLTMNDQDRVIAALPMFHVFCLTVALNAPLMNGGTVIIMPKFSPQNIFQMTKELHPTIFAGVPTMYNYLLQAAKNRIVDFSSIRFCISGGSSMPVALLKEFEQHFDVIISEGYGLSEASPVTIFNPLDRPRKPGSIGQNIVHVKNRIVDEFGEDVAVGEVGELVVQGPNVMKGYYKMPEETMVTLKDDWLYTGDMARMDAEGYFYIVDRKKDMILVGGYNVYPREVEEVLYQHPNVMEAAIVGEPDVNLGESVIGYVVTNDRNIIAEDLTTFCALHLVDYKIPQKFIFLDELPKNATGKILRKNLRHQLNVNA